MRDLAKSVLTLPWAISMFGVQQMANLVSPPSGDRLGGATAALDAVSGTAAQQLDGLLKQTYSLGTGVQNGIVDLMMGKVPNVEFDPGIMMRTVAEMQANPVFQGFMKYGMPPVAWLNSFLASREDAPAVLQEFNNKLYIIQLVTQVHSQLGHDADTQSLGALVERAAQMETFPRLWAVEGLGNYYGDKALREAQGRDPEGLLTNREAASLPSWTMTMLHAGIGMSFAKDILKKLETSSPADDVRAGIARFSALCKNSSQPGYAGAALESLGLATRTLYPRLVPIIDAQLEAVDPELYGYFWHGAGRAMYFEPMNMMPSVNAPWRAVNRLPEETPTDLAYRNALAGICWAITVVNMRHPVVMETFLRHHRAIAESTDAFGNGLTSSLMMRYDTTRDGTHIASFIHYEPQDEIMKESWQTLVTAPCDRALRLTYGELKRQAALEQLFHYRPAA